MISSLVAHHMSDAELIAFVRFMERSAQRLDLGEELDPIVGLHEEPGTFTIPDEPARRRVNGVTRKSVSPNTM